MPTLAQLRKRVRRAASDHVLRRELGEALKLADRLRREADHSSVARRLREVCAVLERCDLFIGNDSGCAHLAAAMNCKTIVISRHPRDGDPNHCNSPLRFAPHCAQCDASCNLPTGLDACMKACRFAEPHCITGVSVDRVVAAARTHAERRSEPRSESVAALARPALASAPAVLPFRRGDSPRRRNRSLRRGAAANAGLTDHAVNPSLVPIPLWPNPQGGVVGRGRAAAERRLTLISLPLAVRYLGAERYGVWATITTTVVWINLLDLGIANTLTNNISRAYALDDKASAARYFTNALLLTGGIAGAAAIAVRVVCFRASTG